MEQEEHSMSADDYQVGGDHYRSTDIQPWAAMEDWFTPEEFKGFLLGCVVKRIQRRGKKGDELEDLKKAHHELGKAIEVMEGLPEREEENEDEHLCDSDRLVREVIGGANYSRLGPKYAAALLRAMIHSRYCITE
jgi:hypothetical protein